MNQLIRTLSRAAAALAVGTTLTISPFGAGALGATADTAARRGGRGSAIVFVSDRDSPSAAEVVDDVYLFDRVTGVTSRLTDDSRVEQFPVISPDGRYLSYAVVGAGIEVCRLRHRAGVWSCGPARGVVSYPTPGGRFAWTPDSRTIVYAGVVTGEVDSDIYAVDLFSLEPARNLTEEPAGTAPVTEFQPTVSPDGRTFAYTADGDLHLRRIDGKSPQQLTFTPGSIEFGAEFSPDSRRIAFHSNRRSANDFDIYVMRSRPETSANPAVDLTAGITAPGGGPSRERFPTWSPDGREIAFWWHTTPSGFEDGEIYLMHADGTAVRNVTANNPTDPGLRPVGDIFPDWGAPQRGW